MGVQEDLGRNFLCLLSQSDLFVSWKNSASRKLRTNLAMLSPSDKRSTQWGRGANLKPLDNTRSGGTVNG